MKHGHCQWLPCFSLGATGMSAKNIPWFPPWLPWLTQHHTHVPMSNSYPMKPYETIVHHTKPLLPQINMAMNWVVLAMFRQTHAWICLTPKKWNMFPENQVS